MPDKVYLPMEPNKRDELRYAMESQFRYKFYNQTEFPFLPSMGIRHIFQSFEIKEVFEYIGMLHLWWVSDPTGTVTGIWESEWLDTPHEGIALAQSLDNNRMFDVGKLVQTHTQAIHDIAEQEVRKQIQAKIEKEEEEESKTVLWN